MDKLQCRYCGNGGCKRKVIAYLITLSKGSPTETGAIYTDRSEIPICGKAFVEIQASFKKFGNVNEAGQILSMRYI